MNPICRNAVLLLAIGAGALGCATATEVPVEERGPASGIGRSTVSPAPGGGVVASSPAMPKTADDARPTLADPARPPPAGSISGGGGGTPAPVTPAPVRAGPAVVALLSRAEAQQRAGAGDAAAATLERALKIEPRNPLLWHRLARLRLVQSRLDDTLALAARSNSLASGDRALMASNWRLIARVHEARGETADARAARERAAGLDPQTS